MHCIAEIIFLKFVILVKSRSNAYFLDSSNKEHICLDLNN